MGDCLNAAIEYATKYNWAVFPVSCKTKKPLTPNGCKDAKKDIGAIKHWWKKWPDASIGIATGSKSNLIVIDEDIDEDKGLDGVESIRLWENVNGSLPETVSAKTGRGGTHLYLFYNGTDIKNRAGLLEGVDVRGEGGYVVAPPSTHPNGTEYTWEIEPGEVPLASVTTQIKDFLQGGRSSEQAEPFTLPDKIQSGNRNDTLFRLACSLQEQGLPDNVIRATVKESNLELCDIPLSDDELETIIGSALRYKKGELKVVKKSEWHEPKLTYKADKNGEITDQPAQTIANAEEAIEFDKGLYGRICYNELAYSPYVYGSLPWKQNKGWREWTNADDSNLKSFIELNYGIKSGDKIMDALTNVCDRHPVNPVIDMLETCHENWDGNKYVENLLPNLLGCEKNEYTIAVMRLFMLGAVARAYKPGCKFDYMLVLVGDQGKGKSTFLRLLALNDAWFNDNFSTLDNTKAVENLRGMWIVELAELQATKRTKDVETIKSFITSRADVYRAPYGRRTEQRPRRCVLAGTSNPVDFLTDRTGNRRFLPITCNIKKAPMDIFSDETTIKGYIAQAWGEIMDEYKRADGKIRLVLPAHLQNDALKAQTAYLEEDPRIGIIQEWLDNTDKDRVCVMMLWREALGHSYDEPKPSEINQLHTIMRNSVDGWHYVGKQRTGESYGQQRCYDRNDSFVDAKGDFVDALFDERQQQ